MEKIPNINNNYERDENGRRNFLKKIAVLAGTFALSSTGLDSFANDNNFSKENSIEIFIKNEIEKCKDIIQNNKYNQILSNPFLVSVLYYSSQSIDKIKVSQTNNSQRIIAGISRFVTPEFRKNYINTLKNISKIKDSKNEISEIENIPLVKLDIPKDLLKNHQDAIDLFIEEGSSVSPMASGLVVLAEDGWKKEDDFSTSSAKGGNTVIIFNPLNKSFYRYVHLDNVFVKSGEVVGLDTNIGTVGHTGLNACKPGHGGHLHLEVNIYDEKNNDMKPTHVLELKNRLLGIHDKNELFVKN